MKSYIALFRGINVGGKNILPMKELVAILEGLGCQKAKTYIQSGNAVFESEETAKSQLANRIGEEIKKRHGIKPNILLLEKDEYEKAITGNPFPEAETEPKTLHVGFLASVPDNPDLKKLENLKKESERFLLMDRLFYLHAPDGIGRSKVAATAEKALGVPMTLRNWRSVVKIWEMAKEMD